MLVRCFGEMLSCWNALGWLAWHQHPNVSSDENDPQIHPFSLRFSMEDLVFLTQEEVECQSVVEQLIQKQPESPEFGIILEPDEWIFPANLEPYRGTPWLRLNVKQYLEELLFDKAAWKTIRKSQSVQMLYSVFKTAMLIINVFLWVLTLFPFTCTFQLRGFGEASCRAHAGLGGT